MYTSTILFLSKIRLALTLRNNISGIHVAGESPESVTGGVGET